MRSAASRHASFCVLPGTRNSPARKHGGLGQVEESDRRERALDDRVAIEGFAHITLLRLVICALVPDGSADGSLIFLVIRGAPRVGCPGVFGDRSIAKHKTVLLSRCSP